jgi:hypothetical protein
MTVRTADFAFLDLRRDSRPGLANHKKRDILTFRRTVAVIELESDDVALAAVNARMRTQVCT